jgi:hypothetical protein
VSGKLFANLPSEAAATILTMDVYMFADGLGTLRPLLSRAIKEYNNEKT